MNFVNPEEVYAQPNGTRRGLPAWTYNNPELTQLEIEQIFLRNWIWVAHVADIPHPGDYQCFDMGNERAFVIRGQDSKIRAFHNLCRHRAAKVVSEEKGHCKNVLVCPFHGWSYHLDGRLKNIPRADTFPAIDKSSMGLKPLDCEIWHGLIFIRFGGDGPTMAEIFRAAEEEISLYKIADMQPLNASWKMDFKLDWKSLIDIDGEGYHVPSGHPELFDLVGTSYRDQVLDSGIGRSHCAIDSGKHTTKLNQKYVDALPKKSYLPESHQRQWIYWGAFPGFVVTLFPDQVEIYQSYPTGYQSSVMAGRCYALDDDRPEMIKARAYNREINTSVANEDLNLIEWSAAGMRSSAFDGAVMSDLEIGVGAFQNQLRRILPVVALKEPPSGISIAHANRDMLATFSDEFS